MSGLFGTKAQNTSTNTKQTSTPTFNGYESQMKGTFGTLQDWAAGKVNKYEGTPAVGWTANQQSAMDLAKGQLGNQYIADVLSGKYLDYTNDPSFLAAQNRMKSGLGDAINSTKTSFNRGGYLSSSGYNKSQQRNVDNYGSGMAELEGRFSDSAKQAIMQAMGVQNNAIGTYSNLAGQERTALNDVEQAKYKEYLRQQGVSESALPLMLQYFNLIRGTSSEGTQDSTTSVQRSLFGL